MQRRQFLGRAGAMLLMGVALSTPSEAALPVVDVTGIGQLALQFIQTVAQVAAMKQQVDELRRMARQLDPSAYRGIQSLLNGNELSYQALTRDVSTLGYTLDRVNTRFRQMFPDEQALRNMRPQEHEAAAREMNAELHSAALVAYRAQSTLSTIEANNVEAKNILSRSESNSSQVAQLQSALQMLALVHQNLVSITRTLSTGSRITSNLAARAVTERRIERERRRRLLEDYATPAPRRSIDSRFLR